MQTLILNGPGQLALRDEPVPDIGDREMLIRVRACAISRRDVDLYSGNYPADGTDTSGFGQEIAGTVQRVGSEVTQFAVGDRALTWNTLQGFSEYVAVEEDAAVPLPPGIGYEEGAIAHMLPPIVYGLEQREGQNAVVFVSGAGAAGLLSIQVARCCGVSTILAADMHPFRLRRAMDMGADHGINAATEEVVRRLLDETDGRGVDLCMECAGEESSFRNCDAALCPSGTLIVIGTITQPLSVNLADWQTRSIRLIMAAAPLNERLNLMRRSLDLIAHGAITLRPLLTHVFPLHRASEAFKLLIDDPDRAIKVALTP